MHKDPKKRIGSKSKDEIKMDPFFKNIDWKKVYEKKYDPPEDFVTYEEDMEVVFPLNYHLFVRFKEQVKKYRIQDNESSERTDNNFVEDFNYIRYSELVYKEVDKVI